MLDMNGFIGIRKIIGIIRNMTPHAAKLAEQEKEHGGKVKLKYLALISGFCFIYRAGC